MSIALERFDRALSDYRRQLDARGPRPAAAIPTFVGRGGGPGGGPAARVKWSTPDQQGAITLADDREDSAGGAFQGNTSDPRKTEAGGGRIEIVTVPRHGASLVAALVEALDRARRRPAVRVEAGRGEARVVLEGAALWTRPRHDPSETLAGRAQDDPSGSPTPAAPRDPRRPRSALGREIATAVGESGLRLLTRFPASRRRAADAVRRRTRRLAAAESAVHGRGRTSWGFLTLAALSLGGTVVGVQGGDAAVAATGALLFALSAVGFALESRTRGQLAERRDAALDSLARARRCGDELEGRARRIAEACGARDPWALAARLAAADDEARDHEGAGGAGDEEQALAAELALLLEADPTEVTDPDIWKAPRQCRGSAWPPDVALVEGADGAIVAGMARLVARVERDLPRPWPVVLWDPWHEAPPEVRTRRLEALERLLPGRSILVFVRG